MRKALLAIVALGFICRLVFLPTLAESFDLRAHDALSDRAVRESGLDTYLKDHLGFPGGIATLVNDSGNIQTVAQWIRLGSRLEDSPVVRVRHHFHNPTLPWDQAGLLFAGTLSESSVLWGQDRGQALGGKHSWHDARAEFLRALTDGDDFIRQIFFRRTFQSLGQLIHLVQDAAVPAHTRNDDHLNVSGMGDTDGFETWAEREENVNLILSPLAISSQPFDPSILTLPPNPLAPIAIARIIDTERYRQTGVPEAGFNIGIAEYSNANFFSDDTIFGDFPFPASTSVVLGDPEPEPKTGELRRYFRKFRDGQVIDHVAVPSALYDFLPDALKDRKKGLDEKVLADYGRLLLPRGIGYSAGLLNYFFRGTLDFTIGGSSTNQTLTITNKSTEAMDGTFTLYADNFSDIRGSVGGASFNLNLGPEATSGALSFTPPTEVQAYILVFQGKLGLEEGAVAGKVNEWYAVTDVTPGSITPGQPATITITIKSSFRRQQQTLVAALFDGNAVTLAATSAIIPNSGPASTNLSIEVTPTTIPSSAPRPISLVVASDADIATITPADLSNQVAGDPMTLVRVGQASRLPIYQRVVSSCQAKIRSIAFASDAKSSGTPTLTINAPANLQDGDILLGHVFFRITSGIPVISDPSGFMVVGFNYGESNIRMHASSKVASGEGGSFTWTATNASGNQWIAFGALIAISGANTSDYEDIDVDDPSSLWSDITPTLTNTTIVRMGIASNAVTPFTITGPSAPYKELYNEILTLPGGYPWFGASYRWFGYSMESNAAEANSASVQADPPASGLHGYSVSVIPGICR